MCVVLYKRHEVLLRLGCSSATLHRKIVAGEICRPLICGAKMRRWPSTAIDDYINSLKIDNQPAPVAPGVKRGRKKKYGEVHDESN